MELVGLHRHLRDRVLQVITSRDSLGRAPLRHRDVVARPDEEALRLTGPVGLGGAGRLLGLGHRLPSGDLLSGSALQLGAQPLPLGGKPRVESLDLVARRADRVELGREPLEAGECFPGLRVGTLELGQGLEDFLGH